MSCFMRSANATAFYTQVGRPKPMPADQDGTAPDVPHFPDSPPPPAAKALPASHTSADHSTRDPGMHQQSALRRPQGPPSSVQHTPEIGCHTNAPAQQQDPPAAPLMHDHQALEPGAHEPTASRRPTHAVGLCSTLGSSLAQHPSSFEPAQPTSLYAAPAAARQQTSVIPTSLGTAVQAAPFHPHQATTTLPRGPSANAPAAASIAHTQGASRGPLKIQAQHRRADFKSRPCHGQQTSHSPISSCSQAMRPRHPMPQP